MAARGTVGSRTQLQQLPKVGWKYHPTQKLKTPYCLNCNHAKYLHRTSTSGSTSCAPSCKCQEFQN